MSIEDLMGAVSTLEGALGKAFLAERVVMRGQDLHHELGKKDWLSVFMYAITGKEFTENQIRYLNFMWVATSYPDAAIWPNQVTALAATARSTPSLSLVAGLAVSEARLYGRKPDRRAMDFFYRAAKKIDEGEALEQVIEAEVAQRKVVFGYGRPLVRLDERVAHTLNVISELGLDEGRYFKLALDVHRYLKKTRGLSLNIAAISASTMADMGLSTEEYQLFLTLVFVAGMVPCYLDAKRRKEGSFFPVTCDGIAYCGPPERVW
ncbi:MAG: hypothetical protein CMK83_24185 [Pseudomonadales bacterium]|jgi:citrate synthase|uniref:citrate/2-methylcitrate synthase n=1 Tax=unclassified Ketobacter TaxID=2639109 RepID=UPI000C44BF4C|nr:MULTISPECIES: citrate/2-methylcitrate synthase [unclassified Ketobacter]MAQ27323.1 hypothetical protein [Pseudomonadales bacterium]MEC8813505.1 citrate/2-methylcitrate synthase [Pseudomonadota bacterium]TNC83876.1 MAG: hypothetical protein CSH49_20235 [Alcanivorax sp.]HAG94856.1 hypothetical protein [Gammaproteobacteria bacterium]MBI27157.1 hypothetical protein [Pseudomonadales bacterium]|tara:strand:- start:1140 stop:1931 length:792 start_codon:yes stop_codon:yes gene_type:complete